MTYALLLHRGEASDASQPDADWDAVVAEFVAWTEDLHRRGKLVAVERLDDDGGWTLRGSALDGPFAEGKEAVVGLFLVDADDDDEALALARECPHGAFGGVIQVRRTGSFPRPA